MLPLYDPIVVYCHFLRPHRRKLPLDFDCIRFHRGSVASDKLLIVFVNSIHHVSFFDVNCIQAQSWFYKILIASAYDVVPMKLARNNSIFTSFRVRAGG